MSSSTPSPFERPPGGLPQLVAAVNPFCWLVCWLVPPLVKKNPINTEMSVPYIGTDTVWLFIN